MFFEFPQSGILLKQWYTLETPSHILHIQASLLQNETDSWPAFDDRSWRFDNAGILGKANPQPKIWMFLRSATYTDLSV